MSIKLQPPVNIVTVWDLDYGDVFVSNGVTYIIIDPGKAARQVKDDGTGIMVSVVVMDPKTWPTYTEIPSNTQVDKHLGRLVLGD